MGMRLFTVIFVILSFHPTLIISKDLLLGFNREKQALLLFKAELDTPEILSTWNITIPHCQWPGVWCGKDGHVTSLFLTSLRLRGRISPSLSTLPKLTFLDLSFNQLYGNISAELGRCSFLEMIDISSNSITGSLPESLSYLPMRFFLASKNRFSGLLPSWLGKWHILESLVLADNYFIGRIPPEIGNCTALKSINLNYNFLSGPISPEICNGSSLQRVDLDHNNLSGTIEDDTFMRCHNLIFLNLAGNKLTGRLPKYLVELPLKILLFDFNRFVGPLPKMLWNMTKILEISISHNLLGGQLSSDIGNALTLRSLILDGNQFHGMIPIEIGRLHMLSILSLSNNALHGHIPLELSNCSQLSILNLDSNHLSGQIPKSLIGLPELQSLVLSHNHFIGLIPLKCPTYFLRVDIPDTSLPKYNGVYDLSHNELSGPIPEVFGNCSWMTHLLLNGNNLFGEIPRSLVNLSNLLTLDLSENMLTGYIPIDLGLFSKLQHLSLASNQLRGAIPESLGSLHSLVKLNLSRNMFSGPIPYGFGKLDQLNHLDISCNKLIGNVPLSFSSMNIISLSVQKNMLSGSISELLSRTLVWRIGKLNLGSNNFSGELPKSIGNLLYLQYLDLHENSFFGDIPTELGKLTELIYLDVSENQLYRPIPDALCSLSHLSYFNVSFNMLNGLIPIGGVCQYFSEASLTGNKDLCGDVVHLKCNSFSESLKHHIWMLILIILASLAVVCGGLCLLAFLIHRWKLKLESRNLGEVRRPHNLVEIDQYIPGSSFGRSNESLLINLAVFESSLLKLSYNDILHATENFLTTNCIGEGGFGIVYRGILPSGQIVAVKRLNQSLTELPKDFAAEMKTLGMIEHSNIVSLLGYCFHNDQAYLVYEYVANGNLESWLHDKADASRVLDWPKRIRSAIGSARGLDFLHREVTPHIIHRDIKSANILLDKDFEPKVADFGLARLISDCDSHVSTHLQGSLGYIPPEYGQSSRASISGDVYSFGVILLELVTGKEPISLEFEDDGENLVGWVNKRLESGEEGDVLDPTIMDPAFRQKMLQVLKVAYICLVDNPAQRPSMHLVLRLLEAVEDGQIFDISFLLELASNL